MVDAFAYYNDKINTINSQKEEKVQRASKLLNSTSLSIYNTYLNYI